MLGRRTVAIGDTVVFDTPYFNGIAKVIDGPSTEKGTQSLPKWLFLLQKGILADGSTGYTSTVDGTEEIWLEDNARYISIVGVDDENISLV